MALYESVFEEAFPKSFIIKAINLTNKIVGRRVGSKIYSSYYPIDFVNSQGKFSGIYCLLSNNRVIRYNYKINNSAEIVSIDFWLKNRKGLVKPDLTLETEGINIVKLIDVIVSILKDEGETEFQVIQESTKSGKYKEDFVPRSGGQVSKKITDSIGEWARAQDISDDRLESTRISVLWRDFQFWFTEKATPEFSTMSEQSFRNYILEYLKSRGLSNQFVRTIKVRTGNKEKMINTDDASEAQYKSIQHLKMSITDTKDFMEQSLRGLARNHFNALIVCGRAGMGKTTTANKILQEEGLKVIPMNGSIRNLKVLYGLFYNNNDPNTVIVMDDVPDIWDKKYVGILNASMDDHNPRVLSFPQEIGKEIKKFQPQLSYTGKILILTNTPKDRIPKAFFSRTVPIELKADNTDVIDDIRINLLNVMPEIPLNIKQELLDFLEALGKNLSNIDFRIFKRALVYRLTDSPSWKKYVYALVS